MRFTDTEICISQMRKKEPWKNQMGAITMTKTMTLINMNNKKLFQSLMIIWISITLLLQERKA